MLTVSCIIYLFIYLYYLWLCCLRLLSANLTCWDLWALQQMVMMGLAKMKQTIHMEMIYHTGEYVASCEHIVSLSGFQSSRPCMSYCYQSVPLKVCGKTWEGTAITQMLLRSIL